MGIDPDLPVVAPDQARPLFKRAAGYQGDALNLPVASVDASVPFYEDQLGFRLVERRAAFPAGVVLERDGVRIGLVENGGDPTQDGAFFEVTNVDVVLEELRGRGLQLGPPAIQRSERGAFRAFFVVAPDGLCFMIGEPVP